MLSAWQVGSSGSGRSGGGRPELSCRAAAKIRDGFRDRAIPASAIFAVLSDVDRLPESIDEALRLNNGGRFGVRST